MRVSSVALASSLAILPYLVALAPAAVAAGPATLVRDIDTQFDPALAPPRDQRLGDAPFARVGEVTYFFAGDDLHGRELWRSEGTDASTRLVIDLCPGVCSSRGLGLVAAGSSLYFWAYDGASGTELWRSDGTAEGTRRAREFCAGPCDAPHALSKLHPVGEKVFLQVTANGAKELWVSDGTEVGTRRVVTWPIEPIIPGEPDKIQGTLGGWVLFEFRGLRCGTGTLAKRWHRRGHRTARRSLSWSDQFVPVRGRVRSTTRALVQTIGCSFEPAYRSSTTSGRSSRWQPEHLPDAIRGDLGRGRAADRGGTGNSPARPHHAKTGTVLANVAPPILGGQSIGVPVVSGGQRAFPRPLGRVRRRALDHRRVDRRNPPTGGSGAG